MRWGDVKDKTNSEEQAFLDVHVAENKGKRYSSCHAALNNHSVSMTRNINHANYVHPRVLNVVQNYGARKGEEK